MSDNAFAKIVADMPEVETLALLSVRDSGPISDALKSKLLNRLLIKTVRRGSSLSPTLHYVLTPLGQSVVDCLEAARPKQVERP